jgi:hypothetical protein
MNSRFALIKYVGPAIVGALASIIIARQQQAPRNSRGEAGYAVLADRVNKLEFEVEFLASHSLTLPPAAPAAPAQRVLKLSSITVQGLRPLQRVPSKLEHISTP